MPQASTPAGPVRPERTMRIARAAAGRAFVRDLVRLLGWTLSGAAGLALALVLADKAAGGLAPWPLLVGAPFVLAVAASVALATWRRWSPLRAAAEVDRALGLKDRLSSAIEFAAIPGANVATDDPFVRLAVRDAEQAAAGVRLKRVVPIRADWTWLAWPVLGAAAVAVAIWVPWMAWEEPAVPRAAPIATRSETVADLAQVHETVEAAVESAVGDVATPEDLRTIEELHEQLSKGDVDPDEARVKAAQTVESLADRFALAAEQRRATQDRLREQLAAAAGDPDADGEASPLTEAIRQGDLEAVRQAVRELMQQTPTMDPEERQRLAEELERLADAAGRASDSPTPGAPGADGAATPPSAPTGPSDQRRQDLADHGVSEEQARQLADETDAERMEQQLRESGVEPRAAEELAERLARENRERRAEQRAREQLDALRESMRDAAQELRQPEPPAEPRREPGARDQPPRDDRQHPPRDAPPDAGQRQDGQTRGEPREPQPGQTRDGQPPRPAPGEQQGQQQPEQPGRQPEPQPGAEPAPAPSENPRTDGQQPGTPSAPEPSPGAPMPQPPQAPGQGEQQQSPEKPGAHGQPNPGQPGAHPAPESGAKPEPAPGAGSEPSPAEERAPGREPGAQPGSEPGQGPGQQPRPGQAFDRDGLRPGQGGTDQDSPGQSPGRGLERLGEQLERLARDAEEAKHDAEKAERLKQMAQELLEHSSPEDREEMKRWAQKLWEEQQRRERDAVRPRPWRGDTETVDARPSTPAADRPEERVVAQWFGRGGEEGEISREVISERIRLAAQQAERSAEQQPLPARHKDLVRRVFRRFAERAEEHGGE